MAIGDDVSDEDMFAMVHTTLATSSMTPYSSGTSLASLDVVPSLATLSRPVEAAGKVGVVVCVRASVFATSLVCVLAGCGVLSDWSRVSP